MMALRKRPGADMNFEASLQKLESIVKRLEEEEIPLETSLKLFADGQTLAKACEEQLRAAENQIRQLLENPSGVIQEEVFEPEEHSDAGQISEDAAHGEEEPASNLEPPQPSPKAETPPEKKKRKDPSGQTEPPLGHKDDELPF